MTPLEFVIIALAVYRVARIITREEGPFGVFEWLRGLVDPTQKTWIGRGLNCALCVGFWVAAVMALILHLTWYEWLGLAGAAALISEVISR